MTKLVSSLIVTLSLSMSLFIMVGCSAGPSNGPSSTSPTPTPTPAPTVPADPTGLDLSVFNSTTISVVWVDNANNETGYKVYCSNANFKPTNAYATLAAGAQSCNVSNLSTGMQYYFWVEAYNSVGTSAALTGTATPLAVPDPAVNLVLAPTGFQQIRATWSNVATNATAYNIYINSNTTKPATPTAVLASTATTWDSATLDEYVLYTVWVEASNNVGKSAAISNSFALGSVPDAPGLLTAVATGKSINLTWTDSSNESSYVLYTNTVNSQPSNGIPVSANITSYGFSSLTPGATYYFWLVAKNIVGNSSAATSSATIQNIPNAPGNFSVSGYGDTSIDLSWTDSSNESGYKVYWSTGSTKPVSENTNLPANSTSLTVSGLASFQTYNFWIEATNLSGSSIEEQIAQATGTAPAAPTGLTVATNGYYQINVTWSDNAANEQGYNLFYSTNGVKPSSPTVKLPADSTSYSLTNLIASTTYTFWVEASNIVAESSAVTASAVSFSGFTTRTSLFREAWLNPAGGKQIAWYIAETNTNINFSSTSEAVYIASTPAKPAAAIGGAPGKDLGYHWILPGGSDVYTPVYIWIDIIDSAQGVLTLPYAMTKGPDMSGSFTATPGDNNINLSWSPVASSYGYRIYYSTSAAKPAASSFATASNVTSYNFTSLNSGTMYYFWVEASGPTIGGTMPGVSGAYNSTNIKTTGVSYTLISTNCVCKTSDTSAWLGGNKSPTNAFDNNNTSLWGPDNGSFGTVGAYITNTFMPMWVEVDLGSLQPVNDIKILWEGAFCKVFRFEGSTDESVWTAITNETAGNAASTLNYDVSALAVSYRYVRLVIDTTNTSDYANTAWGMKVKDVTIYK